MAAEKRKYVRFLTEPNAYAAVGSGFARIGKISDISMGGLAFEYFSGFEDTDGDKLMVTIFTTRDSFFLENLPCLMVCDCAQDESSGAYLLSSRYLVKRCSLQFTTVSENQRRHLEYFIEKHTQGVSPSSLGNAGSHVGAGRTEDEVRRSEVGDQRSEIRGRRSEVRSQRTDDGLGPREEGARGQKSEVRSQKTEKPKDKGSKDKKIEAQSSQKFRDWSIK